MVCYRWSRLFYVLAEARVRETAMAGLRPETWEGNSMDAPHTKGNPMSDPMKDCPALDGDLIPYAGDGKPRRLLTYGTFDTFHWGHINLLRRAKALTNGGELYVALSTDEFNAIKGKRAYHDFETRKKMLGAIRYVDAILPEDTWEP
jgi:cytidyltransferase-like protein